MPALSNPRHERFVRHWLRNPNATEAYRKAGYSNVSVHGAEVCGSRLLNHVEVKRRIRELERAMSQKTEITLLSLLEQLAEDRRQAKALGQLGPAIQATQLQAKLTGHLVERKETGSPGDFAGLKSVAEIAEALKAIIGPEAAAAVQAALAPSEEPEVEVLDDGEVPEQKDLN